MSPDVFADLNQQQKDAVSLIEGPVLVFAGAGSGKTRVLTRRIANLVLNHNVNPHQILAVTFTNKATEEMRERLFGTLGDRAARLWVATFHSAGLRILRQHAHLIGYTSGFAIYDDQDSKGALKAVIRELGLDEKKNPPSMFASIIDSAKNSFVMPEEFSKSASTQQESVASQVYGLYQKSLRAANAMDFGDLLCNVLVLFQTNPGVLEYYQHNLRYVLVDEFQDTNKVQYMLLSMLTSRHRNLFAVGDDDQSIYSFRGAAIGNILGFERDFPGTKIVKLEQNYRSAGNILKVAHSVISRNKSRREKKLWTTHEEGLPITTFVGDDELDEASFVATHIMAAREGGQSLGEIAVFYRTNAQSRALEEALINHSIPYRIYGGLKFYERKEIKDILAYLRLIVNEVDNQAFLRCINSPPRGIGPQTVKNIAAVASQNGTGLFVAAQNGNIKSSSLKEFVAMMQGLREKARRSTLAELVRSAIDASDYEATLKASKDANALSKLENLRELEAIAHSFEKPGEDHLETLKGFLDRVALTSSVDIPSEENASGTSAADAGAPREVVTLMTLHLAKGLEFRTVFLTGVEEGLIPHYRSLGDETAIEEERRLCYVGITRAMQKLYISRAFSRGMFSAGAGDGFGGSFRDASRFAFDIPVELLDQVGREFAWGADLPSAANSDEGSFDECPENECVADQYPDEPVLFPMRRKKIRSRKISLPTADEI